MKPFTAPISDRSREMYGRYMPRYESIPSMRPFNADISDRRRELYGEYMRRYETVPSMQPFDADIGDRSRHLYGDYRPRYSAIKIVNVASTTDDANGTNWVDMTWDLPWFAIIKPDFDISIYQHSATIGGTWAGVPKWRMLINDKQVYPFTDTASSYLDTTGNKISLGSLSVKLRVGDELKMQFRSTNVADGAGDALYMTLYYVTWEP